MPETRLRRSLPENLRASGSFLVNLPPEEVLARLHAVFPDASRCIDYCYQGTAYLLQGELIKSMLQVWVAGRIGPNPFGLAPVLVVKVRDHGDDSLIEYSCDARLRRVLAWGFVSLMTLQRRSP